MYSGPSLSDNTSLTDMTTKVICSYPLIRSTGVLPKIVPIPGKKISTKTTYMTVIGCIFKHVIIVEHSKKLLDKVLEKIMVSVKIRMFVTLLTSHT